MPWKYFDGILIHSITFVGMSSSTTELEINGMTCTNCALGIQRSLEDLGLREVKVNFIAGKAQFETNSEVSTDTILSRISELGYEVANEDANKSRWLNLKRRFLLSLLFSLPLLGHMFVQHAHFLWNPWLQLCLAIPPTFLGLQQFLPSALNSLKSKTPNMDVLISLGAIAAFSYSLIGMILYYGDPDLHNYMFFETAAMILTLVMLGNLIEQNSVKSTNKAMQDLLSYQVQKARLVFDDKLYETAVELIEKGDRIIVPEGDRIPLDGKIIEGHAWVDEQLISGESLPVEKRIGDKLIGGSLLSSGSIQMEVEHTVGNGTLDNIIRIMEQAQMSKPNIQRLGDRVSAIFVPLVIGIALLTFGLSLVAFDLGLSDSLLRSIAVLVISCPCAMGLATPTAVAVTLGKAAKSGILIKGGESLEKLSQIKVVVLDKTGTLTTAKPEISFTATDSSTSEKEIQSIVRSLEVYSSHPLAKYLLEWAGQAKIQSTEKIEEIAGKGIQATIVGDQWFLGKDPQGKNDVSLIKGNTPVAEFNFIEKLKPGSVECVNQLKRMGMDVRILSGDRAEKVEASAKQLNVLDFEHSHSPEEKLSYLKSISEPATMVGDGINDAPSLAASFIGISLSGASEASMESAEVVILDPDKIEYIVKVLKLGKLGMRTIKQNLFWAFLYNIIAIPFAAFGFLSPMIAALSMAFSDVFVIGNAMRVHFKKID